MTAILRDIRYALRSLAKRPGFALTVVLTLALGLGANSAVFSLVDALVLNPFPIPGIERLVMLWETIPQRDEDRGGVSPADYLDWKAQSSGFDNLVAFQWWDVNLTGGDQPERVQGTLATAGFLNIMGVEPVVGSILPDAEADPSTQHSVVLSHKLWTRRFGADPTIVGKTVLLDAEPYQVVGVAAENFEYPHGTDVWAPLTFTAEEAAVRDRHYLEVIGRMKAETNVAQVQSELNLIADRLAKDHPKSNEGRGIHALELRRAVIDIGLPSFLAVWQLTVIFVLLIACVNVANLLLVRGSDRERELSLRLALGASRFTIVRQLLVENLILSLVGAVAALPLAWFGIHLLRSGLPAQIRRFVVGWDQIGVDFSLLLFTAALAVVAALLFGLIPALSTSRLNLSVSLREGGRGSMQGVGRLRGRTILVISEVALALMLLVASGLSIRGTMRKLEADQGFDPRNVMTMGIALPEKPYHEETARLAFYKTLVESLQTQPRIESIAVSSSIPSGYSNSSRYMEIEGQPAAKPSDLPEMFYQVISDGYFETMRIPVSLGRTFDSRDRKDSMPVAIVSRKAAEQAWPGEVALGKRLRVSNSEDAHWATVVGVCDDVIQHWFLGGPRPTVYVPMDQEPRYNMSLVARAAGKTEEVVPIVRAELAKLDANQPVFNVISMPGLVSERMIGLKYAAVMMGAFGVIALLLSAVGLYGLMAYTVSRRTHEIGVRMALGASHRDVLKLTLSRALRMTGVGVAIGLVLSWGAGKLMQSALFGTISLEWSTFLLFTLILGVVSMLASWIPARRALGVDPSEALRVE